MELTFLGRGAAFNPKEGNTSAYFIEDNQLFLIDCGASVFERIERESLLENISCVNLMITHTHGDHCGSMSTLIERCYYRIDNQIQVNIILPDDIPYSERITKLLTLLGISSEMYQCKNECEFDDKYDTFQNMRYIKTTHCEDFPSYGLLFNTKSGLVYYSGDTNDKKLIREMISKNNIDKLYVDTTNQDYPGNVHMYIDVLKKIIPEQYKDKIYCMHFNDNKCIEEAKQYGFNIVKVKRRN